MEEDCNHFKKYSDRIAKMNMPENEKEALYELINETRERQKTICGNNYRSLEAINEYSHHSRELGELINSLGKLSKKSLELSSDVSLAVTIQGFSIQCLINEANNLLNGDS